MTQTMALALTTPAGPVAAGEAAAIQSRIEATAAAMQAGDLDTVLSGYVPGGLVEFAPGAEARGTAALAAGYAEFLAMQPRITFDGHKVLVAGDLALHLGAWTVEGTAPDGTAIRDGGFSVVVLRRDPDGAWRIVIDVPQATAG